MSLKIPRPSRKGLKTFQLRNCPSPPPTKGKPMQKPTFWMEVAGGTQATHPPGSFSKQIRYALLPVSPVMSPWKPMTLPAKIRLRRLEGTNPRFRILRLLPPGAPGLDKYRKWAVVRPLQVLRTKKTYFWEWTWLLGHQLETY